MIESGISVIIKTSYCKSSQKRSDKKLLVGRGGSGDEWREVLVEITEGQGSIRVMDFCDHPSSTDEQVTDITPFRFGIGLEEEAIDRHCSRQRFPGTCWIAIGLDAERRKMCGMKSITDRGQLSLLPAGR